MNSYAQSLVVLATLVFGTGNASAAIINVGFESGDTSDWSTVGQVVAQSDVVFAGTWAAAIGTVDFDYDDYNDLTGEPGTEGHTQNALAQTVNVAGETSLSFRYNFYSWDAFDYDDPGFEIRINGETVLSLSAADIDLDVGLDTSGWQEFSYDLSSYGADLLDLVIYVGNSGDSLLQSWAYIDGLHEAAGVGDVPELDAGAAPSAVLLLLIATTLMSRRRTC